jgi:drug/metabolite transporter (DMT)-like permease
MALVLAAAVCWSLSGVGIKQVPAGALAITGLRALFATPVFLGVLAWRARPFGLGNVLRFLVARRAVWLVALCYAWTVSSFVAANQLTTAANAILLQYTAPIYVVLLSWPLLGERVRLVDVIAVLGCVAGVLALFLDRLTPAGITGNLVAMGSGAGLGLVPLLLRRAEQPRPGESAHERLELRPLAGGAALLLGNTLTVLIGLPWALSAPSLPLESWAVLVGLGTVQIGAAYLFYAAGVRRLRAIECLMVSSLEPILNPVWVALATGERPGRPALVGGALIVLSVVGHGIFVELARRRPAPVG